MELFPFGKNFPCLDEYNEESGNASGHYFHQDLYVAQEIFKTNPAKHVDIGSRVDGFIAHLAAFREVEVFDIRPANNQIQNIIFKQEDLMQLAPCFENYTDSISCLHAIEHFGLGRYGDPLDPDGYVKGLDSIHRMLRKGGTFYFSTPIGPQRIEFNAHRVFSVRYLLDLLSTRYEIQSFSYVHDDGNLYTPPRMEDLDIDENFKCNYGCGIFTLIKKKAQ
jgi:SAM-dependent methyltransferase